MVATPLIPSCLYHVRGAGLDFNVLAAHGCDAICIALGMLEHDKC